MEKRIHELETEIRLMTQSLKSIEDNMRIMASSMEKISAYNSEVLLMKKEIQHMDKDIAESFHKERSRNKEDIDRIWTEVRSQKATLSKVLWIIVTPVIVAIIAGVLKSN
jgi:predicted  nucleic acid-binding Zn-ribbon protein